MQGISGLKSPEICSSRIYRLTDPDNKTLGFVKTKMYEAREATYTTLVSGPTTIRTRSNRLRKSTTGFT